MSRYIVKQGECLSQIARLHGFANWKSIYEHPSNENLRRTRPDPNILFPGDVIEIPSKQLGRESAPTTTRHRFVVTVDPLVLRIRLQDHLKRPYANGKCILRFDGTDNIVLTNPQGVLEHKLPSETTHVTLLAWFPSSGDENKARTFRLLVDHLDPVEEVTGVQARLNNLGYRAGPVDGISGPRTAAAIRQFQLEQGNSNPSGVADTETLEALKKQYGC